MLWGNSQRVSEAISLVADEAAFERVIAPGKPSPMS